MHEGDGQVGGWVVKGVVVGGEGGGRSTKIEVQGQATAPPDPSSRRVHAKRARVVGLSGPSMSHVTHSHKDKQSRQEPPNQPRR